MNDNYTVAVKLSLVNDVSKGLVAMAGQFSMLQKQADVFQAKMTALKSTLAMGGMLLAGGAAIAAPFVVATKMAGNLQRELLNIQLATHASNKEMEAFRGTVEQTGTTFNSVEVAKIGKMIAQSGNFNMSQLTSLTQQFAQFATIQQQLKGTKFEQSTEMGIKLAEVTGHFEPESIKKSLDSFNKLSLMMPGSVDKVLKAFIYAEGTMKNVMGVSDEDTMLMVAELQRMGIQSTRAGSSLLAMISRTIPGVMGSGLWQGKSAMALQQMGLLDKSGRADVFTNGKFDTYKFFGKISNFVAKEFATKPQNEARNDIMKYFQFTWGTTGSRLASIFMSKQGLSQLAQIQSQYNRNPNLEKTYEQYKGTFNFQFQQAKANISSFFTELGMTILPMATDALIYFNDTLKKFTAFIKDHQSTVEFFEKIMLSFAGLMAVGGTLLLVKAGITGLLIPFQLLTTMIVPLATGIAAVSAPALIAVGAIAALGFALYELWKGGYLQDIPALLALIKLKFENLEAVFLNSKGLAYLKTAVISTNEAFHELADTLKYIGQTIYKYMPKLPETKDDKGNLTLFGKVKQAAIHTLNPFSFITESLSKIGKEVIAPVDPKKLKHDLEANKQEYDATINKQHMDSLKKIAENTAMPQSVLNDSSFSEKNKSQQGNWDVYNQTQDQNQNAQNQNGKFTPPSPLNYMFLNKKDSGLMTYPTIQNNIPDPSLSAYQPLNTNNENSNLNTYQTFNENNQNSNSNLYQPFNINNENSNLMTYPVVNNNNNSNLTTYPTISNKQQESSLMTTPEYYQNDNVDRNIRPSNDTNYQGNNNSSNTGQPQQAVINIQNDINVDGKKLATHFAQKVYDFATNTPNSNSMFDSSLSPMPTNVNAHGLGY